MTKKEMAAWYWAVCKAAEECAPKYLKRPDDQDKLESWESFFMEWARLLFVEAGRPGGFPWNAETD